METKFITDVLKRLVQAQSINPPGKEAVIAEVVKDIFTDIGIKAEIYYLNDSERANVVAILDSGRKGPTFVLNGHLDTVPVNDIWDFDPFGGKILNGRLYGLGSSDMKGGIAAIIGSTNKIKNEIDKLNGILVVCFVSDEEKNNLGTEDFLNRYNEKIDYALIAEPSNLSIVRSNRGAMRLKIAAHGVSGHSSNPNNGINAIYKTMNIIDALKDYGNDICCGQNYNCSPSIMVTMIEGGTAENAIPDKCEITIDRRIIHGESRKEVEDGILNILKDLARKDEQFKYSFNITGYLGPWEVKPSSNLMKCCGNVLRDYLGADPDYIDYQGTTEAALFADKGIDTLVFGPGDLKLAHSKNESVEIEQLIKCSEILYILTKKILS